MRTLSFVDRDKFYGLAGCASGGYMPVVASTNKRLKAIATISGMMNNTMNDFGVMTKEQLMPLFTMANEARQRTYETGEIDTIMLWRWKVLTRTILLKVLSVRAMIII